MDNFKHKFVQESLDMMTDLENNLIELEKDLANESYIHNIFRHLHTIKGGALLVGFEKLGSFIHEVETIFAMVREGTMNIDEQTLSIVFQSVDHIKKLLNDLELEDDFLKENQQILIKELKKLQSKDQHLDEIAPRIDYTFSITIEPNSPLTTDTEHPIIYVIDELEELYEDYFLKKQENEEHISFWFSIVNQVGNRDELESLFLFVEDDFTISIQELGKTEQYPLSEGLKSELNEKIEKEGTVPKTEEIEELFIPFRKQNLKQTSSIESKPKTKKDTQSDSENTEENQIQMAGSTRISKHKVNRLMDAVSELITLSSSLKNIASKYDLNDLSLLVEKMELEVDHLREDVFSLNLLPLSTLNTQFKRMIRNLSKQKGKKVEFEMLGGDTELDKHMIESLENPLLHILRNSIDHGIEQSEERLKKGKKETGLITLRGYYTGSDIIIEVTDDGKGIDPKKVRKKAIEMGIIQENEVVSDENFYDLLYHQGLSTAEQVTDFSGRGVGMDVVKKNIESLKGKVEISSTFGKGTQLSIRLPLTLSIIEGLLVEVGDVKYIVPLFNVDKVCRLPVKSVERDEWFSSLVEIEGRQVSILNLRKEFKTERMKDIQMQEMDIIMLSNSDKGKGIAVDKIHDKVQAIIKPIGKYFRNQEYIMGTSILGDGSLALVLDTDKLIHQFHFRSIVSNLDTV
jgi:two-component system chemotaxis sensor kinase CheA